jgi:hypothetical protein
MATITLAEYVGAPNDSYVTECVTEAAALVARHIGTAVVPADVKARAELECGSELYHRRNAPNGIAQFGAIDGAVVRVARDPMIGAYPILAPYLAGPFA